MSSSPVPNRSSSPHLDTVSDNSWGPLSSVSAVNGRITACSNEISTLAHLTSVGAVTTIGALTGSRSPTHVILQGPVSAFRPVGSQNSAGSSEVTAIATNIYAPVANRSSPPPIAPAFEGSARLRVAGPPINPTVIFCREDRLKRCNEAVRARHLELYSRVMGLIYERAPNLTVEPGIDLMRRTITINGKTDQIYNFIRGESERSARTFLEAWEELRTYSWQEVCGQRTLPDPMHAESLLVVQSGMQTLQGGPNYTFEQFQKEFVLPYIEQYAKTKKPDGKARTPEEIAARHQQVLLATTKREIFLRKMKFAIQNKIEEIRSDVAKIDDTIGKLVKLPDGKTYADEFSYKALLLQKTDPLKLWKDLSRVATELNNVDRFAFLYQGLGLSAADIQSSLGALLKKEKITDVYCYDVARLGDGTAIQKADLMDFDDRHKPGQSRKDGPTEYFSRAYGNTKEGTDLFDPWAVRDLGVEARAVVEEVYLEAMDHIKDIGGSAWFAANSTLKAKDLQEKFLKDIWSKKISDDEKKAEAEAKKAAEAAQPSRWKFWK